jgi:hypothetical protein
VVERISGFGCRWLRSCRRLKQSGDQRQNVAHWWSSRDPPTPKIAYDDRNLQFDSVSMPPLSELLTAGALLRWRVSVVREPGSTLIHRLSTRRIWFLRYLHRDGCRAHGQYYPWLWSPSEQRVRFMDDFRTRDLMERADEPDGDRSSSIRMRSATTAHPGLFLSGWQFKNRIVPDLVLSCKRFTVSEREYGRPPVGEEVYGPPSAPELLRLKRSPAARSSRNNHDLVARTGTV